MVYYFEQGFLAHYHNELGCRLLAKDAIDGKYHKDGTNKADHCLT